MEGFDKRQFAENIRAQVDFIMKHESTGMVEEVLTDLVAERLKELTLDVLNELGETVPDVGSAGVDKVRDSSIHISPLDIDHRALVRRALKDQMAKVLKKIVEEKIG